MSYKILAINPGSTSTKIAVYADGRAVYTKTFSHTAEDLSHFQRVADQFEWRKELILADLAEVGIDVHTFDAVIGRGGILRPVESGVYEVNDTLANDLINARRQHASNLGGLIARDIARKAGVKAFIADPVVVDEMIP